MVPQYNCQLCGAVVGAPIVCEGCSAMYYCSPKHRKLHLQMGHSEECLRMSQQMQRHQAIEHNPLELMDSDICRALTKLGCHLQGAWSVGRACPCTSPRATEGGLAALVPGIEGLYPSSRYHAVVATRQQLLSLTDSFWRLPPRDVPCMLSQALPGSVRSWAEYYAQRGLPSTSPAALLLDAVLTVYWGLQQAQQLPEGRPVGEGSQTAVVHYLGPQSEVELWPLLLELGCLLPYQHIQLHCIGPDVPASAAGCSLTVPSPSAASCGAPGCSCSCSDDGSEGHAACATAAQQAAGRESGLGSMMLAWHKGVYHEVAPGLLAAGHDMPQLVIGPNAGLVAYPSWVETLKLLGASMRSSGRPAACLFTDFNEEAVHRAKEMCTAVLADGMQLASGEVLGGAVQQAPGSMSGQHAQHGSGWGVQISGVEVNPFRQPRMMRPTDNALPTCSNGFALWLTVSR